MLWLVSLLAWGFLFWYVVNHPIRGVPFRLRGGGGDDKEGAEEGITGTGDKVYEAGKLTGPEEAQYKGSFDLGKLLQGLMQYQAGLGARPEGLRGAEEQYLAEAGPLGKSVYERALAEGEMTPDQLYASQTGALGQVGYERALAGAQRTPTEQYLYETGDVGKSLYDQILAETQDPYAYYTSTLEPQLQLAEDYINRQAQSKGLIRSGIPIEQMGRAGVDLAIKEAESRMAAREKALSRAGTLAGGIQTTGQTAMTTGQTLADRLAAERQAALTRSAGLTEYMQGTQANRMADLGNLYGQQQQFGLQGMGRQAGAAQAAGQYWSYPFQAQLANYYSGQAAQQALPGQLIGAAGTVAAAGAGKPQYTTNIYGLPA